MIFKKVQQTAKLVATLGSDCLVSTGSSSANKAPTIAPTAAKSQDIHEINQLIGFHKETQMSSTQGRSPIFT